MRLFVIFSLLSLPLCFVTRNRHTYYYTTTEKSCGFVAKSFERFHEACPLYSAAARFTFRFVRSRSICQIARRVEMRACRPRGIAASSTNLSYNYVSVAGLESREQRNDLGPPISLFPSLNLPLRGEYIPPSSSGRRILDIAPHPATLT